MRYNENPKNRKGLTEEEINSPEFDPAEFAPAPDKGSDEKNKHSSLLFIIMCTVFAVLLSFVGAFAPVNTDKRTQRENEVKELFDGATKSQYVKDAQDCEVYGVFYGEKLMGIGVYHTVKGFSGSIEMLVAMNSENAIEKVKIVSENESRGLGDKICSEEFLSQFKGIKSFGTDTKTDLITCATKSSDAVIGGIKDIFESGITTFSVAKELKVETVNGEEIEKEKTEKDNEDEKDGPDDTTYHNDFYRPDTEPTDSRELDGQGGHGNNNNGEGDMGVDGEDVTTVYETDGVTEETAKAPDTKPAETEPQVTDAPDTKPAESEPPVTEPPETEPVETDPPVTEAPADSTEATEPSAEG